MTKQRKRFCRSASRTFKCRTPVTGTISNSNPRFCTPSPGLETTTTVTGSQLTGCEETQRPGPQVGLRAAGPESCSDLAATLVPALQMPVSPFHKARLAGAGDISTAVVEFPEADLSAGGTSTHTVVTGGEGGDLDLSSSASPVSSGGANPWVLEEGCRVVTLARAALLFKFRTIWIPRVSPSSLLRLGFASLLLPPTFLGANPSCLCSRSPQRASASPSVSWSVHKHIVLYWDSRL